ncbi:MAG: DUF4880 domain-containing protein [Hyphomicrobiales bacterium]|nr:MAG: DUF4880 domain-containing protein [Hyphomicrobiales bacterium]
MTHEMHGEADELGRRARDWVLHLATGEPTVADAHALSHWRRQSSAHEAAFASAVRDWAILGQGGREFIARHGRAARMSAGAGALSRRLLLGGAGALAASAAAWAVISPPLDLWPSLDQWQADYRTATGEQRRLMIQDVAVQLDTQTSIAVASRGEEHSIRLIAGQASFALPAQPSHPLVVVAGEGRCVASRGRFDVRRIEADTSVMCFEGEVRIALGGRDITVGAGQQVGFGPGGLGAPMARDPAEVASWQDGFIVFRATPLSSAVAEINRYRRGKVMVLSNSLARKTISGRFRIDRTEEILGWIERVTGASSRTLPGGIVLLS